MSKRRPNSLNRGAADLRDRILDKIARMKAYAAFRVYSGDRQVTYIDADDLAAWIRGTTLRAAKRPGGLGKRKGKQ